MQAHVFDAVRATRARAIHLRNDYNALMSQIEIKLHAHHASLKLVTTESSGSTLPTVVSNRKLGNDNTTTESLPETVFAKVNSVVAGGPADQAGLQAGDKIYRFGDVHWLNHEKLSKVAATVQANEGVSHCFTNSSAELTNN